MCEVLQMVRYMADVLWGAGILSLQVSVLFVFVCSLLAFPSARSQRHSLQANIAYFLIRLLKEGEKSTIIQKLQHLKW